MKNPPIRFSSTATAGSCRASWCSTPSRRPLRPPGIDKEVSPHTFRHSFATHLLAGGANIRQVQELLGHESITTTEIYTHLDTGRLHAALNEHHPLGKRYRER